MRRMIKAVMPLAILLPALALTGCGANAGADNPMWGSMVGGGLGMASQHTYRPWQATCSTWGGRTTCNGY